jgi:hypothetical protein
MRTTISANSSARSAAQRVHGSAPRPRPAALVLLVVETGASPRGVVVVERLSIRKR